MGGGKGSAPSAPDYTPIAMADMSQSQADEQIAGAQMKWAQQQYADISPYTKQFLTSMISNENQQTANAQNLESQFQTTFQPLENQFAATASGWNSPTRAAEQEGSAITDVANASNAARTNSLQALESYGIDPSQTRYGALDLGSRIQQAAGEAAAGTQSRVATQQEGLALMGQAINIGSGVPSQVGQAFAGAAQSGNAGIGAANNTIATGAGAMGTPLGWSNAGLGALGGATNTLNTGFQNQLASYNANQAGQSNFMGGLGGLVGGALGMGAATGWTFGL